MLLELHLNIFWHSFCNQTQSSVFGRRCAFVINDLSLSPSLSLSLKPRMTSCYVLQLKIELMEQLGDLQPTQLENTPGELLFRSSAKIEMSDSCLAMIPCWSRCTEWTKCHFTWLIAMDHSHEKQRTKDLLLLTLSSNFKLGNFTPVVRCTWSKVISINHIMLT